MGISHSAQPHPSPCWSPTCPRLRRGSFVFPSAQTRSLGRLSVLLCLQNLSRIQPLLTLTLVTSAGISTLLSQLPHLLLFGPPIAARGVCEHLSQGRSLSVYNLPWLPPHSEENPNSLPSPKRPCTLSPDPRSLPITCLFQPPWPH